MLWWELAKLYSKNFISFPIANYISRYTWSSLSFSLSLSLSQSIHSQEQGTDQFSRVNCTACPNPNTNNVSGFFFFFFFLKFFIFNSFQNFPKNWKLSHFYRRKPKKIPKFSQFFFLKMTKICWETTTAMAFSSNWLYLSRETLTHERTQSSFGCTFSGPECTQHPASAPCKMDGVDGQKTLFHCIPLP